MYHIIINKRTTVLDEPHNWQCQVFCWSMRNWTTKLGKPGDTADIRRKSVSEKDFQQNKIYKVEKRKQKKKNCLHKLYMWLTIQSSFQSTFWVYSPCLAWSFHSRNRCRYQSVPWSRITGSSEGEMSGSFVSWK